MNDEEKQVPAGVLIFLVLFGLGIGFISGLLYQSHKDKQAVNLYTDLLRTYATMQKVTSLSFYPGGNLVERWEISNDESSIGYLELHFIPRKSLTHEDIGNPETDGEKPTKDADDWARKN